MQQPSRRALTRSLRTRRLPFAALLLGCLAPGAWSQTPERTAPVSAPDRVLALFDVAAGSLQSLQLPDVQAVPFSFEMDLEGELRTVYMRPHDVRSKDFRLLVDDGTGIQQVPTPVSVTYRGKVDGFPESVVAATLHQGELNATLLLAPGRSIQGLQAVRSVDAGAPAGQYLLYDSADNLRLDVSCGTNHAHQTNTPGQAGVSSLGAGNVKICEVACDADVEYYQSNGSSVTNTQADITGVINAVEAIYEPSVEIVYEITTILVRTAENDPYSSSNSSTLLGQFQGHWNGSQGGIQRDIAHLFTGKNLSGSVIGVAYLGVICSSFQGYGLSQSKFTGNFTQRVALTTHEMGHNWNAGHCDGQGDCMIMCSGLGGCAGLGTFGNSSVNSITSHKNSRTCLETPTPPILFTLNPTTAQAFAGGSVTLSGFNFNRVEFLDVGPTTLDVALAQFTVVNDTTITFGAPTASAIGAEAVVAHNLAGASNSLNLSRTPTSPPLMAGPPVGIGGANVRWDFGADPDDAYYLFISINNGGTFPFMGFDILANLRFLNDSGFLNAAGIGSHNITPPVGNLVGKTLYAQVLFLADGTFAFAGATNIIGTNFIF